MTATEKNTRVGGRWLRRALAVGWKLAIVAALAAVVVYRLHFAPLAVAAQRTTLGPVTTEVLGTGTLQARVQSTISPKISGLLAQVLADQGDRVTRGQLLATLDDADPRRQVAVAQANLAAQEASVDVAGADIAAAEATARQADASYGRNVKLAAQGMISADDFDKSRQQRDLAQALLHRAQLAKTQNERAVALAQANLHLQQQLLDDTRIASPFDGLVLVRSAEAGDAVVPGSAIFQVISVQQLWISAWVDETAIADLAVGQTARVVFRSQPQRSYPGVVTRLAPSVDQETREFLVDVTVAELPEAWSVGQRAEVYIQTAHHDHVLQVPARAVTWRGGQAGVFVDAAGRAHWQPVDLGLRGAVVTEVTSGLAAGQVVIWPRESTDPAVPEGRAIAPVFAP